MEEFVFEELRKLSLSREGEFVVVSSSLEDVKEELIEVGVLYMQGKRCLLDEDHDLVANAIARNGGLFWKEKEWIAPNPEQAQMEMEEQRWLLKQLLSAAPVAGIPSKLKVYNVADLKRLITIKHDAHARKRIGGGEFPFIVVLSGAGISVAAGIQDFRTPKTGFYASFDAKQFGLSSPEEVFALEKFNENPNIFYKVERAFGGFYSGKYAPTNSHKLVALLGQKGMLLKEFTQNVDGLSVLAGLSESLLVEAHGNYRSAHCPRCKRVEKVEVLKEAIFGGSEPRLAKCAGCVNGVLKPMCVFFGEALPSKFWKERSILKEADILLVMGTSLQVEPFASLVDDVRNDCVRVLLNRDAVGPFMDGIRDERSFCILGDVDETAKQLLDLLK